MGLDTALDPEYRNIGVSDYPSISVSMTIWAFGFSNCCQPLVKRFFCSLATGEQNEQKGYGLTAEGKYENFQLPIQ